MPDRKSVQVPAGVRGHTPVERWENEGRADDAPELIPTPCPDLNALLAHEQTAIMSAEAATDIKVRDKQRETARRLRALVDLTPFPSREPHDFDRLPGPPGSDPFAAEFEALKQHVDDMETALGLRASEGEIGVRHNMFEHRNRLIRQARGRLNDLA